MGDQALDRALDVDDLGAAAVPGQDPGVGDLATGFGVERRPVQDHAGDLAGAGHRLAAVLVGLETTASTRESVRRVS